MAKRRLTKRQQTRINSRVNTDDGAPSDNGGELGVIVSHHGKSVEVLSGTLFESSDVDEAAPRLRAKLRANLPLLVCGDRVRYKAVPNAQTPESPEIVIEQLLPRKTLLERPRPYTSPKPVASNLDLIVMVLAVSPVTNNSLIDRYLIAAAQIDVEVIIVINKLDCLSSDNYHSGASTDELSQFVELYGGLGYRLYSMSSKQPDLTALAKTESCASLMQYMQDRTCILVGQSGVGKSSMLNFFAGSDIAAEGEISDYNTKGKHTTTHSALHVIQTESSPQNNTAGIAIIDSPGIREFGLWHLTPEQIVNGMPEIQHYAMQCQFRDCDHQSSKGCKVIEAIEEGAIEQSRAESFRIITDSIEETIGSRER